MSLHTTNNNSKWSTFTVDPSKPKAYFERLPVELTSKIIDNLAFVATDDETSETLDKFYMSLSPSQGHYLDYPQDLLSLMGVNKLFYNLVTTRFLTTITVASHTSQSLESLKTDDHPFVFSGGHLSKPVDSSSNSLPSEIDSNEKSPGSRLPMIKKLLLNCYDKESSTLFKYDLSLDWSQNFISNRLTCLTVDTSVFTFVNSQHEELSDELLVMSKKDLASGFAKLVALQENEISCTFINSKHHITDLTILIQAFDQYHVLTSVENLQIISYLGHANDDLSIIQSLVNLKKFTFESSNQIARKYLPAFDSFSTLKQLTFKSADTPIPPNFPKTLKKLSTYNYSFFHNQLDSQVQNHNNLVELRLNFIGELPCNISTPFKFLKTLIVEGQIKRNLDTISQFISQNSSITALSIPVSAKLICGYFESRRFFPSLRNIECLNLCFESSRLNDTDIAFSDSVLENIFTHMHSLNVLLLQSTSSHISLEHLIHALTGTYSNRTTNLTQISLYFTLNTNINFTASPLECFRETTSTTNTGSRFSFFPDDVVLNDFVKIKNLAPIYTQKNVFSPTAKIDIDVKKLKMLFIHNPSTTSTAKASECFTRRIAQIHQIPWFL